MYNLAIMLATEAIQAAMWTWVLKCWFPKYFKK